MQASATPTAKKLASEDGGDFAAFAMHVILDDLLQPDAHMDRGREHESEHGERDQRRAR